MRQIDRCAYGLIALLVAAGVGYPLTLAIQGAREAAYRSTCNCRMKQLGIALANYHDTFKTFPPAYIADADGRPKHSWRVLLLPYFEDPDLTRLASEYDFDEPWDGPHNRLLANDMPQNYRCAMADTSSNRPNYVAIVGAETAWPGAESIRAGDLTDGASNTIVLAETVNAEFNWLKPRDLSFDEALQGVNPPNARFSISSHYRGGVNCLFGDGAVHFLSNDFDHGGLRNLFTRAGGESPLVPDQ